jgi:hypothetical protein
MKDSHLYKRMSDYFAMKSLVGMIETCDVPTVVQLYNNITEQASDHPKYQAIVQAYNKRMTNENI